MPVDSDPLQVVTELPCADATEQLGESIGGTATASTSTWLLLEYVGPWGAKAVEEARLPTDVREHLSRALQELPDARAQLIRQTSSLVEGGPRFYLVCSRPASRAVWRFSLESYEDLVRIDFAGVLAGRAGSFGGVEVETEAEPLVLVCTNGKRDACCARRGPAVYQAFADIEGISAWQTTHLGGHRFAATAVVFPEGLAFGRLAPDEAKPLVESHRAGRLHRLARYRGRTCHPAVVQAAEHLLRERLQTLDVDALELVQFDVSTDPVTVEFEHEQRGRIRLELQSEWIEVPKSCGQQLEPVRHYRLLRDPLPSGAGEHAAQGSC